MVCARVCTCVYVRMHVCQTSFILYPCRHLGMILLEQPARRQAPRDHEHDALSINHRPIVLLCNTAVSFRL